MSLTENSMCYIQSFFYNSFFTLFEHYKFLDSFGGLCGPTFKLFNEQKENH